MFPTNCWHIYVSYNMCNRYVPNKLSRQFFQLPNPHQTQLIITYAEFTSTKQEPPIKCCTGLDAVAQHYSTGKINNFLLFYISLNCDEHFNYVSCTIILRNKLWFNGQNAPSAQGFRACNFLMKMGPSFLRKCGPKTWPLKGKGFKFLQKTWFSKNLACFFKELEPICLREPRKHVLLGNLGPLALGKLQVHFLVGKLEKLG